jgi:hypothetical protein
MDRSGIGFFIGRNILLENMLQHGQLGLSVWLN